MTKYSDLIAQEKAIKEATAKLKAIHDAEGLNDEQMAELTALHEQTGTLTQQLKQEIMFRDTAALDVQQGASITGGAPTLDNDEWAGFRHAGEFAQATKLLTTQGVQDSRIDYLMEKDNRQANALGSQNKGSMEDGGVLVPPAISQTVYRYLVEDHPVTSLMTIDAQSSPILKWPTYPHQPWNNGVRVGWVKEGGKIPESTTKLSFNQMELHKLAAIVSASWELEQDAGAINSILTRSVGEAMGWELARVAFDGTGMGEPLGIKNSKATMTVPRQTAGTVELEDFLNMDVAHYQFARNPGSDNWYAHHIHWAKFPRFNVDSVVSWMPASGGLQNRTPASMLGTPMVKSGHVSPSGTEGDVWRINWALMHMVTKAGEGVDQASSIYFKWDTAENSYRTMFRADMQPFVSAPIRLPNAKADGSEDVSPFVRLAA